MGLLRSHARFCRTFGRRPWGCRQVFTFIFVLILTFLLQKVWFLKAGSRNQSVHILDLHSSLQTTYREGAVSSPCAPGHVTTPLQCLASCASQKPTVPLLPALPCPDRQCRRAYFHVYFVFVSWVGCHLLVPGPTPPSPTHLYCTPQVG